MDRKAVQRLAQKLAQKLAYKNNGQILWAFCYLKGSLFNDVAVVVR